MAEFKVRSGWEPRGDQPKAIESLVRGLEQGMAKQTLYGVTGSGKTLTMAWVVEKAQKPTLVLAHNKTLAAQLYGEFRELFPENAVEYFVSYYDYYQPEAYVPSSDVYIAKEATINDQIDRMKHATMRSLLERKDVLIVASVSCIYGIGPADSYAGGRLHLAKGGVIERQKLLHQLVEMQYNRNDVDFHRGTFRVRGNVVEIFPAHEDEKALRLVFWDNEIEAIAEVDPIRGKVLREVEEFRLYPNTYYTADAERLKTAIKQIQEELQIQLQYLKSEGKLVEEQRLRERTLLDLEMLQQFGYCNGVENYSRFISGRSPGEPPPCLLDYFGDDFLLFVDESHVTLPQVRGMSLGDRSRKQTLVEYGFRLPSAVDNRPLTFQEFEAFGKRTIYVSATPGEYEAQMSQQIVEQIIRPTGLLDPEIEVRPVKDQVDNLFGEILERTKKKERVLVTTLTKKMAEKLAEYYKEMGIAVRYLHADIETLERVHLLRDLRQGRYDVLIGVNLLREGLDLPEVSLVAILEADQKGFLRTARSLLQTVGRAARHLHGRVLLYADQETDAIKTCIEVTRRQRALQLAYNEAHQITPQSIHKGISSWLDELPAVVGKEEQSPIAWAAEQAEAYKTEAEMAEEIKEIEQAMLKAASHLRFEEAAKLRDKMEALENLRKLLFAPLSEEG